MRKKELIDKQVQFWVPMAGGSCCLGPSTSLSWTTGIGTTRSERARLVVLQSRRWSDAVSTVSSFVDPILAGTATGD
jgi:hypothetical protein